MDFEIDQLRRDINRKAHVRGIRQAITLVSIAVLIASVLVLFLK